MGHKLHQYLLITLFVTVYGNTGLLASDYFSLSFPPDTLLNETPEAEAASFSALTSEFKRAIDDLDIVASLTQINPNQDKVAKWDNYDPNIYHVNMRDFTDTLHYVLRDSTSDKKFVLPCNGIFTSGFGPRRLFGSHFHYGLDIDLEVGDSVAAAMDGTIRIARYSKGGYGNFVIVSHQGGLETLYGHLSETLVSEGQKVKAGEVIGLGGNTGRSTGAHLHLEVLVFGERIDPAKIISTDTRSLHSDAIKIDASWFDYLHKGDH